MTASLRINKKDNKYYVHLNWKEDGKRKQKCIGTGLSASGNNKRRAQKCGTQSCASGKGKFLRRPQTLHLPIFWNSGLKWSDFDFADRLGDS